MDDLIFASASSIADAIRDKKVSALEVVEAHLRRIEEINPKLLAVVQLVEERALQEARAADEALAKGESKGPLHGVPITIKDSLDTADVITAGGTKGRASFVPDKDATVVARMRGAGAILIGKTNTPELTMSGDTENLVYPRTNNPYDLSKSPGGSSGGAAAIIAAGGSPLDLGSDTGGSIRLPAHKCGIAGIKPNSGRAPRTGHIVPYALGAQDSLTQNGPMARYVEDLVLTLPIISGPDWRDPAIVPMPLGDPGAVDLRGLRVAMHTDNGVITPVPEIVGAVKSAAQALGEAGLSVEEDVPEVLGRTYQMEMDLTYADGGAWIRRLLQRAGTKKPHPVLQKRLDDAKPISTAEFTEVLEALDRYRSDMLAFMENYDVILCPTEAFPALSHGEAQHEDVQRGWSYTSAYNMTGWPAAVVRGGATPDGMPIGVQVVARPWREDVVLAVAQMMETSLGGWQRPPI